MERKLDFTHEVTVPEMLVARDHRVELQRDFIARFGQPDRIHASGAREIWTYDPNPWWLVGWTEIEIGVASNKIDGHWLDD